MVEYYFKGAKKPSEQAAVIGMELDRIASTLANPDLGEDLPQAIVDAARPEGSILHDRFIWDDTYAANSYRKGQARALIRAVEVVHIPGEVRTPWRYNTTTTKDITLDQATVEELPKKHQGYMSFPYILSDSEALRNLERTILGLVRTLMGKLQTLQKGAGIYQDAVDALARVEEDLERRTQKGGGKAKGKKIKLEEGEALR